MPKVKKQKKYKHFLSKLVYKQGKAKLVIIDLSNKNKIEKKSCILTYDFGNIQPSENIVQEYSTGRYFIYDNNNKILCFSRNPVKNSDKDDKSRPLIEMFLEDEIPRLNPTLYIKEFDTFSCLMVIGGYRISKDKSQHLIYPSNSIKVFRLENKIVSTSYVIEIFLSQKRMNPIIVKHKEQLGNEDEEVEQLQKLLIFMGGNNIQEFKKANSNLTYQSMLNANVTCEVLKCDLLYDYMRRGIREKFQIQQTIRLKYKDSLEHVRQISDGMLRGCVIQQKKKNQEPRRFLFCEKKSQVLEIKYINIKEKLIELLEGELKLSTNSTIQASMAKNIDNTLYYITNAEKKVKVINLTNLNNMKFQTNFPMQGVNGLAATVKDKTILHLDNDPPTPTENKAGICQIF